MVLTYKNLDSQLIILNLPGPKIYMVWNESLKCYTTNPGNPLCIKRRSSSQSVTYIIRMDILLHKTLLNGTHLSFYVTSQWGVILYCYVLPLGPYASIPYSPQALMLKNIQRVCSRAQTPVPQNMRGGKIRWYQSCPWTKEIHTAHSRINC
jgi:hypothetical protein